MSDGTNEFNGMGDDMERFGSELPSDDVIGGWMTRGFDVEMSSLAEQQAAVERFAEVRGWTIVEGFADTAG